MWSTEIAWNWYSLIRQSLPGTTNLFDLQVLTAVWRAQFRDDPIWIKEIAIRAEMSEDQASRIVKRFLKDGIFVVARSKEDRRRQTIVFPERILPIHDEWTDEVYRFVYSVTREHLAGDKP